MNFSTGHRYRTAFIEHHEKVLPSILDSFLLRRVSIHLRGDHAGLVV